jgi:hypothetical protein
LSDVSKVTSAAFVVLVESVEHSLRLLGYLGPVAVLFWKY